TGSPFVRSAMRKAAVWASDASPAMISCSTAAASSTERSMPEATRSIASVRIWLGKEVLQQLLAVRRKHRLRVELDALGGQLAVPDAHHGPFEVRRALEAVGEVRIDHEGVIAAGHER